MCWTGGSYYSVDEFELAVEAFLKGGRQNDLQEMPPLRGG